MTIVYDFDGTIADTLAAAVIMFNRVAEEKGFKVVTKDNFELLRSKSFPDILRELGVSIYQAPMLFFRARRDYKQAVPNLKIQPGMENLFYKFKSLGYKQGILTSNSDENVQDFLRNNKIDLFDFIHGGHSAFGKGKALKKIIKDNGLAGQEVIYIGDEIRDIQAARQAGIKNISVSWGFNNREALEKNNPDALVDKPEELFIAVKNILGGGN